MSAFNLEALNPSLMQQKVVCAVCGVEDHSLFGHIKSEHGLTPEQYAAQYPGQPLMSELGQKIYAEMTARPVTQRAPIVETAVDSMTVFGVGFGPAGDKPKGIKGYVGYTDDDGVPTIDPNYVFQKDITRDVLMGVMAGARIFLTGPTGSGKTTLPEQIAARTGRPYCEVAFHQEMEPTELTGTWTIGDGGKMTYLYSALANALQKPSIIVFDEFDSGNPGVSALANAVLQRRPLVLANKGGEKIKVHPDCIIFGTGNTLGLGDETGLYASTTNQSFATMNRWSMNVPVNYMKADDEQALLKRLYAKTPDAEIRDMVKVANLVRDAFVVNKVQVVLSTRQLVEWGRWLSMTGNQKRAFDLAFGNMLSSIDRGVVTELFQKVFGTR